jgi:hypothetical protein
MDGCWIGTCKTCGKRLFKARSEAKKAAKQLPGDHLIAYRCPSSIDLWHLGHPSKDVREGLSARGSYIPGRAVKQGMAGRRS